MKKYFYLFAVSGMLFLASCGDNNSESNEAETEEPSSLEATKDVIYQIDSIKSVATGYWGLIEQSDSTKHANIERLLTEISYNPSHDATRLSELQEKQNSIKALAYGIDDIPHPDTVFAIDNKIDKYIAEVMAFKNETGMEGYPLAKELSDTIAFLNKPLITSLSGSYAENASVYNAYIDLYKTSLEAQGKNYKKLKLFFEPDANEPAMTKEELDLMLEDLKGKVRQPVDTVPEEPVL